MIHQVEEEDNQTRVLYELCSLVIHTLKLPPLPFPFPTPYPYSSSSSSSSSSLPPSKRQPWWTLTLSTISSQDSPAAFASLFLGISLSFMLLGSLIFLIGLLLLPWVALLVLLFYVAAFFSNLSLLGRFILGSSIRLHKDVPDLANILLKL